MNKFKRILLTALVLSLFCGPAFAANRITFPIGYYPNPVKSVAIGLGSLYIGEPDTDPTVEVNQKQVSALQENGSLIPIAQPISLSAGGVPTYNGASVSLYVDGDCSMKVLDSGGVQEYYIANAVTITAENLLPIATERQILQKGADEWEAIDKIESVNDYGAIADDGIDDSTAIADAFAAGVYHFPAGTYLVSTGFSLTDKRAAITGAGSGATTIEFTGGNGTILFDLTSTVKELGYYEFRDIRFNTSIVSGGTAIKITDSSVGTVHGGADTLKINNVVLEASGLGYWTIGIRTIDCGGVYIDNYTHRNANSAIAAADINTKGISIESNTGIAVIRALHIDNFYIQRASRGIYINNVGSVESIYLGSNFEILGGEYGLIGIGVGEVGAVSVMSGHFDTTLRNIYFTSELNVSRFVGCDFRCDDTEISKNVELTSGESVVFDGCLFSGATTPTFDHDGIDIGAVGRVSVDGCIFRNLDTALTLTGSAGYMIGANGYYNVTTAYDSTSITLGEIGKSEVLTSSRGTYEGIVSAEVSLDDLAGAAEGLFIRRLGLYVSEAPIASTGTTGSMVETRVWDINKAFQTFYRGDADEVYYRRKSGASTWSAWTEFTLI